MGQECRDVFGGIKDELHRAMRDFAGARYNWG